MEKIKLTSNNYYDIIYILVNNFVYMDQDIKKSKERMILGHYPEKNIKKWVLGEQQTLRILKRIADYQKGINISTNKDGWWNTNIDHIIKYSNGNMLIIDSKKWHTNYTKYVHKIWKSLKLESDFLQKTEHIKRPYLAAVMHNTYIPHGIQNRGGFYLVNPNYLWKFIREIGEK